MLLFIGNTSQYAWGTVDPEKIKQAQLQFEATAATFNKVLSTCAAKCINHEYGEGDLAKGEMSCVDRCVAKYVHANRMIGENFTKKNLNPYFNMGGYEKARLMMNHEP